MNDFFLNFEIYDYIEYINVLNKYKCYNNFYDNKKSQVSNSFINDLLQISKNRCFICGFSLEANTEIGIYAEREHLINKTIDGEKNKALNKCKKNIVPICRICNGKKITVKMSDDLKKKLKKLEYECNEEEECSFDSCFVDFKKENFDFNLSAKNYKKSQGKIYFDFISQVFYGNEKYINQFDLNYRTNIIFNEIFKTLYNVIFTNYPNLKNYIKLFSKSTLDDELIDWLDNCGILNFSHKRDNLIETIVLLENL